KELLSVDPSHAGAQSLASQIADHKREEFVSLCLAQARRLQAEGEIGRALAAVSQGLEAYPKEPRFEQLQATLQRALKPAEPPAAVGPAADLPITVTSTVVPTTAPAAAPMPERAAAAPKRRPPWLPYAAAGAAAVLLVGIAVGVTILRQHAPPPKPVTAHKSAPPSAPLAAAAPLPAAQPTPAEAPAENAAAPEPSSAARAMGTLRIETGEDGVAVYLNGEKYRRATTRGRLSLSLPPKPYAVHLEKPGLWAADQAVDLRGGDEARLAFHLVPAKASLEIRNAPPGAEVWLDGAQAGSVGPGGAFSTANIEPGSHTVALKKDRFKPSRAEYVFDHGATVTVDGALQSAVGNLKIEVSPAGIQGLQVRLSREGDAQDRPVGETELSLMEGTYQVTASAPQYSAAGATVRVVAGRDAAAALVLKRIPSAPQPKQAFTMEDWVKSEAPVPSLSRWTREEKVWVRRGGDFVLAPVKPAAGTYLFTAIVMKGKRLEWVLNFRDDKNYDLFQMDDKELARTWFVNGKKTGSLKIPHPAKAGDYVSVMIAVTAGSVVHSIFAQQQWRVIDKSERSGLLGRFGFHIPGKDQIGVSDFRFMPQ
ncbi:MAG: PEGA domain-containing protein, partial [Acidobacteriia bacterium]|nr:PEGA domain-containing protein [Terriglobia bacterium]